KRIGLGEIVVTARPQPLDPIINLAERRKDERRRLDTLAAQRANDRQTVELGQHAIDDQHVILAVERVGESLLAVGRQVGDMPDLAECLRQIVGGVAIVFDDQETHDESAVSWISDVPRRGTVLDCTNHSGTISKCPGVGPRGDRPCQREKCEGRRFDPPPLNQLRTGGGGGGRGEVRREGEGGRAPPPGSNHRRGRGRAAGGGAGGRGCAPFAQALPSRSATNFVASPDFTRMRIVRLPSFCASLSALRTSAGLATFLPPTSRMTSPVLTPWSEAIPLGSTSVTTTPSEPLPATWPAGTTVRPRRRTSVPSAREEWGLVAAGPAGGSGVRPRGRERFFSALLRHTVSFGGAPGAMPPICLARSLASLTGVPLTAVITSPAMIPALAAGPFACGSATSAPSEALRPRLSAISAVTGWICTPIQPRLTLPLSLS